MSFLDCLLSAAHVAEQLFLFVMLSDRVESSFFSGFVFSGGLLSFVDV